MTDEALDKVLSYTVFFIFSKPKRNMNKIGPFLLTVCDLDSILEILRYNCNSLDMFSNFISTLIEN